MRVYGDRARTASAEAALEGLTERLTAVRAAPGGLARHSRLTGLLIEAAALHQGVADVELARRGADEDTPAQRAGLEVLVRLARGVTVSWKDPARALALDLDKALRRWRAAAPEETLSLRVAEGFAHYAVYPEAYLEAARSVSWATPPRIVGLRSIGAALGPMVAAAFDDDTPVIAPRPVGDPFARRLALGESVCAKLLDHPGPYAVVDEGPGLSGSSFGAVGDLLEDAGVPSERIVYLPSHDGAPGPMANARHRERWGGARRVVADFDRWIGPGRLAAWCVETFGPLARPLEDLSGGAWRSGAAAPVLPIVERRKFLADTESGPWLLKFAGLDAQGQAKAERARALAAARLAPDSGGLLHGFLASRWITDAHAFEPWRWDRTRLLDHLASYLAFRASCFPAQAEEGADLAALADMAAINASEALGEVVGQVVAVRLRSLLAHPPKSRPVHVDGRLHVWEWRMTSLGRLLKTDAVDHSCAHDLVGCQDIAWDVAGAELELELSPTEAERLARILGVDPRLLTFHRACYPAFQLGLWSFAPADETPRVETHVRRYREALRRFAGQNPGEDPWMESRRRAT
jgi:hypothetical protein